MSFSQESLRRRMDSLAPEGTGRLLVAYSGGLDSHVLLHALVHCAPDLSVLALHVDHAIHPDSAAWARHCERVCAGLGVELVTLSLGRDEIGGSNQEERAREARYRVIADFMRPGDLLLTAQHRDDQAETLMLQLLRGAGLRGLASMAPCRGFGPGRIARPLLDSSREELAEYARRHELQWLDDPSNTDTRFDRNYLRHTVMPLLRQRWPAAGATLARSAGHLAEAQALLDQQFEERLDALLDRDSGALDIQGLLRHSEPEIRAIVRHWIQRSGMRQPSTGRLKGLLEQLILAAEDRQPRISWPGGELRRYRNGLYLMPPLAEITPFRIRWSGREPLTLPQGLGRLELVPNADGPISAPALERGTLQVAVGLRQGVCRLPGRPGKRLKLLFQELGVPPWQRDRLPIVLQDGEIGAIADRLVCCCLRHKPGEAGYRLSWCLQEAGGCLSG